MEKTVSPVVNEAGRPPTGDLGREALGANSSWHVRATSVPECVDKLAQIWSSAAVEAEHSALTEIERQRALADPRLGGHLDQARSVRVRMRTSVLTLVVIAPRPETSERAMAAINALHRRHPSRAIVLSPGDFDGPASMDAHIYAECRIAERSDAEVCTEQILVKVGGELSQHLSRVVAPLLIHDLPVVLWWPDDPTFGTRQFREIAGLADRLLVDTGTFAEDGRHRLAGLAAVIAEGVVVCDIGWLRLNLWRELLAGLFDHPLLTREAEHIRSVRVDFARPGAAIHLARALYIGGWLAGQLGWEIIQPIERGEDDSFRGLLRRGRREIRLELRPVRPPVDAASHAPGSLLGIDIEASRARTALRARVTRQRDHLLATADWNGAPVARRAGRLEQFDEAPFIAEALEQPGLDRLFERSLVRAARLRGG
ncbi:MAG TPA: glucose-6-phosphate dehydrogenase assembly protein OpcA [Candidatus Limnocylindrales bacterium]|nr:glucose-6-phosphate dehydrogenase assembly protein OpcA [Candidatus Limnocylindrales bacterium]